jgi:hypothetical protein
MFKERYLLSPSIAQVRKEEKRTHFTIEVIGDAAAYKAWKADESKREAEYQARMAPRRAKSAATAAAIISGDVSAPELTLVEKAEIAWWRNLNAKVTLRKYYDDSAEGTYEFTDIRCKSLWDQFKGMCKDLWNSAFPN